MINVAVIFADGMEEIEALTPVDVLRRAGVNVTTYSVSDLVVKGSHGIEIKADKLIEEMDALTCAVVVPGGMPGAKNISENQKALALIKEVYAGAGLVSAICASPAVVLTKAGIVKEKRITCYPAPDFIQMLKDSDYTGQDVCVDGNLITANGPKSAMKFSLEICKALNLNPKF